MSRVLAVSLPSRASEKPRRKWASIIPELPRAPSTAPRAAVRAVSGSDASPSARRASATERSVSEKLVPVSPSGTGKTLIRLISSRPAATQSAGGVQRPREAGAVEVPDAGGHRVRLLGDDRQLDFRLDLVVNPDRHRVEARAS